MADGRFGSRPRVAALEAACGLNRFSSVESTRSPAGVQGFSFFYEEPKGAEPKDKDVKDLSFFYEEQEETISNAKDLSID